MIFVLGVNVFYTFATLCLMLHCVVLRSTTWTELLVTLATRAILQCRAFSVVGSDLE